MVPMVQVLPHSSGEIPIRRQGSHGEKLWEGTVWGTLEFVAQYPGQSWTQSSQCCREPAALRAVIILELYQDIQEITPGFLRKKLTHSIDGCSLLGFVRATSLQKILQQCPNLFGLEQGIYDLDNRGLSGIIAESKKDLTQQIANGQKLTLGEKRAQNLPETFEQRRENGLCPGGMRLADKIDDQLGSGWL
jgi:hypothetical protein